MARTDGTSPSGMDENSLLRIILEGTAGKTGEQFFFALVENLTRALGAHGAWVTEYLEEEQRLRSLAFRLGEEWIEDYEYDIAGTPCEPVIKDTCLVHIPQNVVALYPSDPDLEPAGAVSYMGVPLLDVDGGILGHLAVLDTKPRPKDSQTLTVFRIFAERATAELRRLRAEEDVREREEQLSRLLESAMDAIVELDSDFAITLVNQAADEMFGCSRDVAIGRSVFEFLDKNDRQRLLALVKTLGDSPSDRQHSWIPQGLTIRHEDGRELHAEATLARYESGHKTYLALILRNINDRIEAERRIRSLSEETEYLRNEIKKIHNFEEIIGHSKPLMNVLREVEQVADTDASVLIHGETGTGKELFAHAIHSASRRKDRPFIKVNCAAVPATLIESEFFGHEKGAFTGATQRRDGRFTLAHRGTIFLDEVGELPLELQSKLLRVLQEGEFEPVGSSHTRSVDVRVLAATNRDLEAEVKRGVFREDLFYRLNVFPIVLPPLRERGGDITHLASEFAARFAKKMGRTVAPLTPDCIRRLQAYDWPGNVRELQNVIERAVITAIDGRLNLERAIPEIETSSRVPVPDVDGEEILTARELNDLERRNVLRALESCSWRVSGDNGAAALLGIHPSTLASRIKSLGIKRPAG